MIVKMFNLEREHEDIKKDLLRIFEDVLSGGEFIQGKEVRALEESFASYIGVKYAIGVGNGTDAIRIGGLALDLKAGDKFVTTPNTYVASAMALSMQGLVPLFCDIELETYNMDPEKLEDLLKRERDIKLCIPVHLYGHPCRMDEIMGICKTYGVKVMEDACQAHGALYKDRKVGGFGDVAAFSFYPTKNLGCYGDGGIVVTDSEEAYRKAIMLRNYGQTDKHVHAIEGFNSRLDEVQAAFLRHKLEYLDQWNEKRRHIAWFYRKELEDTPLVLPAEAPWAHHVYHVYVVRSKKRDDLRQYLSDNGVSTLIHYPTPIHLQGAYGSLGFRKGSFVNAEQAAGEIISLPMYPTLKQDEILHVCGCIREFYGL
ncbi:MAG: dTDP-3-amino-3,6-dideoxy-alpha-D-galactopyranose transaminase [Syntrophorhabdus sp. PtaU1.Bin058]|nr:MAG: dTDP-3-amino-3,6-dideoxy-alpha-D-galactopyranose transaminase [Syntrophorhabdus sp. PtaU1.Bin058]